jgi:hypothetical protein
MKPSPKIDKQRERPYARGGKGAPNKMPPEVPAERAPAGRTGPSQVKAPGARAAKGGPRNQGFGVSSPAQPGRTAPAKPGRGR